MVEITFIKTNNLVIQLKELEKSFELFLSHRLELARWTFREQLSPPFAGVSEHNIIYKRQD